MNRLQQIINEEITKTEVASMIQSKLKEKMGSKEFEKKVKELSAAVLSEFFKILYQRDSFWKQNVAK